MSQNIQTDLFNKENISDTSQIPLYFQIMTLIKHYILSGTLKPGDMIPSEKQLCEIYNISRSTVRQALDLLAEENFIIRQRGRGTFIADKKIRREIDQIYSFTTDMKAIGLEPHSLVLEKSVQKASKDIAKSLKIQANTKVFKLTRVRYAKSEPLLLENTYVPYYLCNGITDIDFSETSLYNILHNKYNLKIDCATETYEAIIVDKEVAKLLNCKKLAPAFNIERIAYLKNGIPFEITDSIVRSDKCLFQVKLKSNKEDVGFSRKITL
ncbi:MAG: GntR family transcriptional regulator [Halanaerobiales bacterium]